MNLSRLMVANAAFATLGALVLILMPAETMKPYGVILENGGIFLGHLLGSVLLGFAIIYFHARNIKERETIKILSLGAIAAHGGSAIFGVLAVMANTLNSMTWVDIILHGLFALGFWYYGLRK